MSTGQRSVFVARIRRNAQSVCILMHSLCVFGALRGGTAENLSIRHLTSGVRHAILAVLTHLVQLEVPMFNLIFLIPMLTVLILGILLLAVLCSR